MRLPVELTLESSAQISSEISMTPAETVTTDSKLGAVQSAPESNGGYEWGLILAVVLIGVGIGNLLAAYSIVRFYRWRGKQSLNNGLSHLWRPQMAITNRVGQ